VTQQHTYRRRARYRARSQSGIRSGATAAIFLIIGSGCTDHGLAKEDAAATTQPADAAPVLSLLVEPATVNSGGYAQLTWSAEGAEACEASGDWQGLRAASGLQRVGPLDTDATFRLSCAGPSGTAAAHQVSVTVDGGLPPEVRLHAAQETLPPNGVTRLNWTADHASHCLASGGWSGERPVTGAVMIGPLQQTTRFRLSCSSSLGTALAEITVRVTGTDAAMSISGRTPHEAHTWQQQEG
jgi:hypothetical protein